MGKRILLLIGAVGAAVLLIVGVAAAAGNLAPSDPAPLSTTAYGDIETTVPLDTTTVVDETTVPSDETTVTEPEDTTTTAIDGEDDGDDGEVEDGDTTESSEVHPDNFGGTISSMRHAGDYTPAAVVKGKEVPGWTKHHPAGTTTTQPTDAPVPAAED